jgi:hypothetical protein
MKSHYDNIYLGLGIAALFTFVSLWVLPNFITMPATVQMTGVSPSFWPKVTSWSLVGLGLLMASTNFLKLRKSKLQAVRDGTALDNPTAISKVNLRAIGMACLAIGAMVGYYFLVEILGMMLSSMVALFGFTLIYGERRYIFTLPVAVLLPLLLNLFFGRVAHIPVPQGLWGW